MTTTSEPPAAIEALGLGKAFGAVKAVDGLDLSVPSGGVFALLGPNGAGKTTLLRILATLLRPTSGTLALAGLDAIKQPEAARGLIGVVAHGSYVYEDLSALENLRFWTVMAGGDASPERLRAALRQVELDGVAGERARTFSAGMKRRLALARVVLSPARLLLLDEPFTGLDQQGRKWLNEFVLAFKASGGTVVIATHSFATGLATADRVAVLAGGRLLADQPCANLTWEAIRGLYEGLVEAGEAMPREVIAREAIS
jgi:heme ABC exporter ATP-binding subunit CcmA